MRRSRSRRAMAPAGPPRAPRHPRAGSPRADLSVLSCRLKVWLPEGMWLQAFTTSHPDVRIEVQDRMEVGRGLVLMELQVLGPAHGGWSEEIRGLPGVRDVELISASEGSELCRVVFRGRGFLPLLKRLRLLRHLPFPVQAGVATWTVVGPGRKVRRLLDELARESTRVHVEAIHPGALAKGSTGLTARQQEILRRAMAEGYFDVPRRISLTALAPKIGVALSTLSVTLAVIERKVLEPHA